MGEKVFGGFLGLFTFTISPTFIAMTICLESKSSLSVLFFFFLWRQMRGKVTKGKITKTG